jgi:hypothetical protein
MKMFCRNGQKEEFKEKRTFDHISDGFAGQIKERLDV